MATLHAIYLYLATHYVVDAGIAILVIATITNRVFPDGKLPTWLSVITDLLALLAKKGQLGILGALSLPFVPSRKRPVTSDTKTPPTGAPPVAMLIPFLIMSMLMSSCVCWTPSNVEYNSAKCVTAREVVSCVGTVAGQIAQVAAPIIASGLLAGTTTNVDQIAQAAESDAPGAGICILASVEADLPVAPTTGQLSVNLVATRNLVHSKAYALVAAKYGTKKTITVRVKKPDGSIVNVPYPAA